MYIDMWIIYAVIAFTVFSLIQFGKQMEKTDKAKKQADYWEDQYYEALGVADKRYFEKLGIDDICHKCQEKLSRHSYVEHNDGNVYCSQCYMEIIEGIIHK